MSFCDAKLGEFRFQHLLLQCVVPYVLCSCVQLGKRERAATSTKMLLYNAKSMLSHGIASRYTRIFIVKILSDVHLKRSLRLSDWIIRTFAFTLTMLCALVCVFALILPAPTPPLLQCSLSMRLCAHCVYVVFLFTTNFLFVFRQLCECSRFDPFETRERVALPIEIFVVYVCECCQQYCV